ncbi:hypothetical protein [Streptomyces sp. TR06-5]|uniref:hypothetical protein n=1 Tax=unclassified Streptomyces TaxID=2593676 RepID=UPI0039A2FC22
MRRWVKAAIAAAVCVGLGGWIGQPYAQDWWVLRDACDGSLPPDAVRQLAPEDAHLADDEWEQGGQPDWYRCTLRVESRRRAEKFLTAAASTRVEDREQEFDLLFSDGRYSAPVPLAGGLPGFLDQFLDMHFLVPCPDLGEDADGRQQTLVVRFGLSMEADGPAPAPAVYEAAVTFANAASEKLGCGAESLEVPEAHDLPASLLDADRSTTVPLDELTAAPPCGSLAGADLPDNTAWRASFFSDAQVPYTRCSLLVPEGRTSGPEDKVTLLAWYGDWSTELVSVGNERLGMTGFARCDGQDANFALNLRERLPGRIDATTQRALLTAFARDEVRRRDCSDLRFTW